MIEAVGLSKVFGEGSETVRALDNVSLSVAEKEFIMVVGRSGSGKSTLLSLIGGLTVPTSGSVKMNGRELSLMSDKDLSVFRGRSMGFVFQFSGLLPTLTALENVMLPSMFVKGKDSEKRARALLEEMGLGSKANSYPSELSGGEIKRVAVARALINDPALLLADEPTGDLDEDTEHEIMKLFRDINRQGKTILMVTHNPELSSYASRLVTMDNGRILVPSRKPRVRNQGKTTSRKRPRGKKGVKKRTN